MNETHVQGVSKKLWGRIGAKIYDLSQGYRPGGKRHATTRQTPGIPDLWIFVPNLNVGLWMEVKALKASRIRPHVPKDREPWMSLLDWKPFEGAMLTPELYHAALASIDAGKRAELYLQECTDDQVRFRDSCLACRTNHLIGGLEEVLAWIETAGLLAAGIVPGGGNGR